jgi:HAD superfamily hydrolase (TIGR01509 family)
MDGTIVDTEPLWIAAETELVAAHGRTWTLEDSLALMGSPLLEAAEYIRQQAELPMAATEIRDYLIGEVLQGVGKAIEWCPGARELLLGLRTAGIPCALVTMSYRVLAEAIIDALPEGTFAAVVTGDEVTHGKPDPEPYLTAAGRLGVAAEDCVVIEDSGRGVEAGVRAGARVLGVQNAVPIEERPGVIVRESLDGVTPETLAALWNGSAPTP